MQCALFVSSICLASSPRRRSVSQKSEALRFCAHVRRQTSSSTDINSNGRQSKQKRVRRRSHEGAPRGRIPRTLQAKWGGLLLAESNAYKFIDGRFFFPGGSVRWEHLVKTEKTKFHNPIGIMYAYDIVIYKHNGDVLRKNRAAVQKFQDLKKCNRPWEGYTFFWKGVRISMKTEEDNVLKPLLSDDGFCEGTISDGDADFD